MGKHKTKCSICDTPAQPTELFHVNGNKFCGECLLKAYTEKQRQIDELKRENKELQGWCDALEVRIETWRELYKGKCEGETNA